MPVCFVLVDKSTGKSNESFVEIDNKMCEYFGVEPDTYRWLFNWYNCLGMLMAMGRSYNQLREIYQEDDDLVRVINWLEDRYTIDYWRE